MRGASIESLAIAAGGAFACASSVAALKDEVVGELARSVPLAVPLLDDFDHSSRQYDELAAGAISASRCVETPSRHRRDSCPSDEVVGGFFFIFEAVRTASSDRDAPPRRCPIGSVRRARFDAF